MIKAILVFNNHGKPRVNKFYQYYVSSIYVKTLILSMNVHVLVVFSKRPKTYPCFSYIIE